LLIINSNNTGDGPWHRTWLHVQVNMSCHCMKAATDAAAATYTVAVAAIKGMQSQPALTLKLQLQA
jgi:hypothetical protein